jgi:quinoprotein glucose dehydrogenase
MFASRPKSFEFKVRGAFTGPDKPADGGTMQAKIWIIVASVVLPAFVALGQTSWQHYGADAGGSRFSDAKQINRGNASRLKLAWTYRTGDVSDGSNGMRKSKFEATPILFNGSLYVSTPFNRVIALDPASGKQLWVYDPEIDLKTRFSEGLVSRGVSAWNDVNARVATECKRTLFLGTIDARLIAIDAETGKPCNGFGSNGQVDLKKALAKVDVGEYEITSPPAVVNGVVVVGSAIGDNRRVDVERGIVRAFDARTGTQLWQWDPLPSTNPTGAANAWSAISSDPATGLVFVPTGSASPDFYGGERPGDNALANSVVALRASTGQIAWHFQVVHHDLWDYDVPAQPLLTIVRRGGKDVSAVVVNTKMGHVFVLERTTGKPLFPVEERITPQSDVRGEISSKTQPFPVLPPPLYPQKFSADQAWGTDEMERSACKQLMAGLRYEGIFTPPSLTGTMIYPGYIGGVNWGSASADRGRGVMVVNVNNLAFWVRLIPRDRLKEVLTEVRKTYGDVEAANQSGTPYAMARGPLISPKGNPCVPPPWGKTVAVDLNTGAIKWESASTFGFGGPITTAGGLVFVSGAVDQKFRALDIDSGKELWSTTLPVGAQSTPMTYQLPNGKQYVVIAAGGHGSLPGKLGDYLLAYALP